MRPNPIRGKHRKLSLRAYKCATAEQLTDYYCTYGEWYYVIGACLFGPVTDDEFDDLLTVFETMRDSAV